MVIDDSDARLAIFSSESAFFNARARTNDTLLVILHGGGDVGFSQSMLDATGGDILLATVLSLTLEE